MVEFLISGPIILAGVAPGVVVPVSGTLSSAPPTYIGTIGTILSPVAISGSVTSAPPDYIGTIGTVASPVVVGTIQNAPLMTVQGMVAVSAGVLGTVGQIGTLGTLQSPVAVGTVQSPVAVATVLSPVAVLATVLNPLGVNILPGGTVSVQGTVVVSTVQSPVQVVGTVTLSGGDGGYSTITGTVVVATVQSPVVLGGGTVGTVQAQSNIAIASLVGSIASPIAIGGGTVGVVGTVGTVQSPVQVVGTVSAQGTVVIATVQSPVAIQLLGGTLGTVLSPVQVVGTVSTTGGGAGYSTVTGTVAVSTVQSPVGANLLGGTLGTVQSPVAVVGTVTTQPANGGTVVVATVLSPVQIAGTIMVGTVVSTGTVEAILLGGTVGTIQSPVGIAGGTIGTLQSQANIAIASLVGSIGSPIGVAGGTIGVIGTVGTVLSPVQTAPLGSSVLPVLAAVRGYAQEAGSGSLQVNNQFPYPKFDGTVNVNYYNPLALVFGSVYPLTEPDPDSGYAVVQQTGAAGYPSFFMDIVCPSATIGAILTVNLYRQLPVNGTAQTPDQSFQFFTGTLFASQQTWMVVTPNLYWPYDQMVVVPLQIGGTLSADVSGPGVALAMSTIVTFPVPADNHVYIPPWSGVQTLPNSWLAMLWAQTENAAVGVVASIPHTVVVLPTYDGSTPGVNVGTVGTIQSPVPMIPNVSSPTFHTISATIAAASGTLYGVIAANLNPGGGTVSGTVIMFHSDAQRLTINVPPGQTGGFMLSNGMLFTGSLVASIMGTLSVTVLH